MAPTPTPVEYSVDGQTLVGYAAHPNTAKVAPGVLIAHEAMGISEHVKSRAQSLAEVGYAAFALDLYGSAELTIDQARARSAELMRTPGLLLRRAQAGLQAFLDFAVVDNTRVAAIGFCQGGSTVMELARSGASLLAVIGFHPGFHRPAGSVDGRIGAKVLMMSGDADPVVSQEDRSAFMDEMRSAGADWQLHLFGGVGHSFTNPQVDEYAFPGFAYDAAADRRSWQMMHSLLSEVFA